MPAIVNFCRREQGILIGNEKSVKIRDMGDLAQPGIRIVNRPLGTGTRLLFDRELSSAGLQGERIEGYGHELHRHLDVGLEILSGRADAGPGIRAVAGLLDLDFLPLRWERFDFIILKDRFFDQGIQLFLGLLHNPIFKDSVQNLAGYDLSRSGEMVFPQEE